MVPGKGQTPRGVTQTAYPTTSISSCYNGSSIYKQYLCLNIGAETASPPGICYLTPTQVPSNSIHQELDRQKEPSVFASSDLDLRPFDSQPTILTIRGHTIECSSRYHTILIQYLHHHVPQPTIFLYSLCTKIKCFLMKN